MPKYVIIFDVAEMLQKIISDGQLDIIGFDRVEVTVTVPTDLTPTQISSIMTKLPFVQVTKL